jgi:tripartite-type tricarboxylate transporter receptor subunit TctC
MRLVAFCVLLIAALGAQARAFPDRPVRLVVPYTAGGSTDLIARALGHELSAMWGQPVVIDNRPGAGTIIASDIVARSAPDGHTLLVTTTSFTIVPSLTARLPYDPDKDFEPITLLSTTPLVLVVNPSVPARSVTELIALAKARPGQLHFGSAGSGGSNHLAGELFNAMAGVKLVHIPFKGNAPALNDLVGGHVDVLFNGLPSAIPLIKAGKLRPLAVTSLTRAGALPDVPTLDEMGLKGFRAVAWSALSAPARTPEAVIAKISADARKVLHTPALVQRLKAEGSDPVGNSPEEFAAFLREETVTWRKVIELAGIKALQ